MWSLTDGSISVDHLRVRYLSIVVWQTRGCILHRAPTKLGLALFSGLVAMADEHRRSILPHNKGIYVTEIHRSFQIKKYSVLFLCLFGIQPFNAMCHDLLFIKSNHLWFYSHPFSCYLIFSPSHFCISLWWLENPSVFLRKFRKQCCWYYCLTLHA